MDTKTIQSNITVQGDEVLIRIPKFLFDKNNTNGFVKLGNADNILSLLDKYRGVLSKDFPDGSAYVKELRGELSKEWDETISN